MIGVEFVFSTTDLSKGWDEYVRQLVKVQENFLRDIGSKPELKKNSIKYMLQWEVDKLVEGGDQLFAQNCVNIYHQNEQLT